VLICLFRVPYMAVPRFPVLRFQRPRSRYAWIFLTYLIQFVTGIAYVAESVYIHREIVLVNHSRKAAYVCCFHLASSSPPLTNVIVSPARPLLVSSRPHTKARAQLRFKKWGCQFLDPGTGLQAPPTLFLLLLLAVLLSSDLRSAKAFSFHNRSSPNFAYT